MSNRPIAVRTSFSESGSNGVLSVKDVKAFWVGKTYFISLSPIFNLMNESLSSCTQIERRSLQLQTVGG